MTIAALIMTSDAGLADDLLRLAAAASTPVELAGGAPEARARWPGPPLVLVGADAASSAAVLPPRPGVVLVSRDPDDHARAARAGAQDLAVLPGHEDWLVERLAAAAEPPAARGPLVCVRGARGGAGASVLATALGLVAARAGLRTLLVDGDAHGGGLDSVLTLEDRPGVRWPDLAARRGRLPASTLREALPALGDLSVLSWRAATPVPVAPEAATAVLDAAVRGYDLTIADLPRHPTDLGLTCLRRADTGYLLVPAEIRAVLAAGLMGGTDRLIVVLPGALAPENIARALALPLTAVYERDRRLAAAVDAGEFPRALRRGPLTTLCEHLLSSLPAASDHRQAA
ncbi:septum site-determining protein Ssd [Actinomadura parmotrematis]|uniref:Rv3660c-like CheY-like N-terminal domain-containing protein n=1 Tax=Actinomadura parmotrematis TaxID=2864039 RepID=A0ABS7FRC1_9ACTN|nr:septum site-determining protein Ssd [Actinomadura parmotrematis]MBW8482911.1 hypothetical protein [Actinomadura parmotrematis]